MIKRVNR